MAGHSKFKNIMHRKGAQDAKRGKIFTRLGREIIVAARSGQPDPNFNPRLRTAIAAAKAANMPKDKIENAIKKGSGELQGEAYEEIRYEGYGPNGVAVIVEAMTDNRNRTASEVRTAFTKSGGNLGETGSVSFMFEQVGMIEYPISVADEDTMFEAALEAGASNCEPVDELYEITTALEDLGAVRDALAETYGDASKAKLVWQPQNPTPLDLEGAEKILKLIDVLDDNDDVQDVYAAYDISDEIAEKLAS